MRVLRHAFRTLAKTPFVTMVAILSLALGIGANTAIFSLFDQMLLRALPVEQPEELVNLSAPGPNPGSQSCNQSGSCQDLWSYPMFRDLEREQVSFTGIAAHRLFGANLALAGSSPTRITSRRGARPASLVNFATSLAISLRTSLAIFLPFNSSICAPRSISRIFLLTIIAWGFCHAKAA